jgi:hypothetical protein
MIQNMSWFLPRSYFVECVWNLMAHGDAREGKWRGNWWMEWVASTLTLSLDVAYPALLTLMRTPRLPAVDWTDDPADLNGLVRLGERRNLVSARVPSRFKRSLTSTLVVSSVVTPRFKFSLDQTKGRAAWAAVRGAKLQGALRCHWNHRQHGAGKLRFPHSKECLRKLSTVWARVLKNVCQLCRGPKKFTKYGFRGAPLCLGQARNAGE